MRNSFIVPLRILGTLIAGSVLLGSTVSAQPSGGPYGPQDQNYEIPADARQVYYVAPDGRANADGRVVTRPTTLETAIEKVVTGDAIILRGGEYRTGSLFLNQGITMQPYQDERPVLKGTEVAADWEKLGNGLWRTKWDRLFPSEPAEWWRRHRHGHVTPIHWFNNDMVFIDGQLLQSAGWEGEVDESSYFIDYDGQWVYIGADPADRLVEITAHDGSITRVIGEIHGKQSDRKGYTIRGVKFTQYAYRALEIEGTEPEGPADPSTFGKDVVGTTLENVTITYCSRVAAYLRGDDLVIRNCLVSDTETEGIYVLSSGNVLLERNIIRRNNMQNMKGYFPAAVKIFNQCYNTVCRDNFVVDMPYSSGIWYDVGNVDGVFINNWIENSTDGFFFEISKGAIAAGNVFVNCEKGIRSLNSSGVVCYQNTFVNSMASFERDPRSAQGDHFGWHPATGPDVDERVGHVFVNNLLVADHDYRRVLLNVEQAPVLCGELTDSQLKELRNNIYVQRTTKNSPLIHWSPIDAEPCMTDYRSIASLKELGFEQGSREWLNFEGAIFQNEDLERYGLLPSFPGASGAGELDAEILKLLGWSDDRVSFPGAFAPLETLQGWSYSF